MLSHDQQHLWLVTFFHQAKVQVQIKSKAQIANKYHHVYAFANNVYACPLKPTHDLTLSPPAF